MDEPEHIRPIVQRVLGRFQKREVEMQVKSIQCPYCSTEMVHLQAIEVNRNGEITSVDRQGTKMKAGDPSGRGARVDITLWCESGHQWKQSLQFHKGNTFIENKILIDGCPTCFQTFISDLWRD